MILNNNNIYKLEYKKFNLFKINKNLNNKI